MYGEMMAATYPALWTAAMPWARTSVGISSAPYCSPMLNVMLTQNRPMMAKAAEMTASSANGRKKLVTKIPRKQMMERTQWNGQRCQTEDGG